MTSRDLVSLLPILLPAVAAVAVMLLITVRRHHTLAFLLTLAGVAGAGLALPVAARSPHSVADLVTVDGYAVFYTGLLLAASFVVALLCYGYWARRGGQREEVYILLLLATSGSTVLVAATHFAAFFLGLEVLSVSLYGLIAYERTSDFGLEAGIKYLVLAAVSAAFLLFGMALLYADTGTLDLAALSPLSSAAPGGDSVLVLAGAMLILVGVGFKLGLVPFHLWTPDVYQGAPPPVAAFIATVSKGAVFALLLRFFGAAAGRSASWGTALTLIAVASMLAGNLLALLQSNVKRLLGYSSIAHLGYLLVALLAGGSQAVTAAGFYLVAYFVTSLGAWGALTALAAAGEDAEQLESFRGLAWRRPWVAGALAAMFLSLAGIPLTAGFLGKFQVLAAGVGSGLWLLAIVLVLSTAIGLVYYLRVLVVVFAQPEEVPESARPPAAIPLATGVALVVLTVLLFGFGVYPAPLLDLIRALVSR